MLSYCWGGVNIFLILVGLSVASKQNVELGGAGALTARATYVLGTLMIAGWIGVMANLKPARWFQLALLVVVCVRGIMACIAWDDLPVEQWGGYSLYTAIGFAWFALSVFFTGWPLLPEKYTVRK